MNTQASRLAPLFRSDTQADILARVLLNPDTKHTITQLAELTGASYATTHREVRRLVDMGLFTEKAIGRASLIGANTNSPTYAPAADLVTQSHGPTVILTQLLSGIPHIDSAYIYGSWAARRSGKTGPPPADIDVLVIGNPPRAAINDAAHRAEQQLGRDVNIRTISRSTWEAADDPFTRTVRDSPLHELDLTRDQ